MEKDDFVKSAGEGNLESVKESIDAKGDPNARDKQGSTRLRGGLPPANAGPCEGPDIEPVVNTKASMSSEENILSITARLLIFGLCKMPESGRSVVTRQDELVIPLSNGSCGFAGP